MDRAKINERTKYNCFNSLLYLIALLVFISGNVACKRKRTLEAVNSNGKPQLISNDSNDVCPHIPFKTGKFLTRHVNDSAFDYKWVNAKFSCDMLVDSEEHSFSVTVRSLKDSVIWMSASKLGITGMRCLITRDSVKMVLMLNQKKYFKGNFAYINELLNAELDFDMLQALFFGNSTEFYDEDEKLKAGKEKSTCQYFLSTVRKRKMKKIQEGETIVREPVQAMWINPNTFKIERLEFDDAETHRKFTADYSDFRKLDGFWVPFKLIYNITAEKNIHADIKYQSINRNEPQTFPFTIPSNYEPIEIKKK